MRQKEEDTIQEVDGETKELSLSNMYVAQLPAYEFFNGFPSGLTHMQRCCGKAERGSTSASAWRECDRSSGASGYIHLLDLWEVSVPHTVMLMI